MTTGALEFPVTVGSAARSTERSIARTVWIAAIAAYLALASGTAMTRQPYGDEGELASPAYNLMHRGHLEVTQWEQARLSHKAYWMPPMFFFAQAAWEEVVGFGVIQFRLATVAWGLLLLFAVGYIVRKISNDSMLAALVAFALGTDYTYLQHAGVGRCEIMSAALAIAASAVYLRLRDRSLTAAVFISHGLMTLSGLTHPVGGMMWMPCLIGLQLWLDGRRLRWSHYALGVLPYLIGGAAWGAYIVQDPAEFRRQFFGISLSEHRFAGFAHPITALRRELGRFLAYYGVRSNASLAVRLKVLLPAGYIAGIIGSLLIPSVRRLRLVSGALLLLAVQLFILTFIEGTKQSHYIVHIIPTLVVLLVAVLWSLYEKRPRLIAIAAIALVGLQIGAVVFRMREDPYHKDWLPAIQTARPFVQQGLFVIGGPEFAMPFNFPENVVSRPDYGYASRRIPDVVLTSIAQLERNTALTRNAPAFYRYMTVTFYQRYQRIFQHGDIAIYRRVL